MNKLSAKKRIEQLKKVINHHRYLYHVLDQQEISDASLDSLKRELKVLEDQFPDLVTPDSPTQRVGGRALESFAKIRHRVRQWSLDDAFSESEIREWENRIKRFLRSEKPIDYVGELKIDGFHVVLTYKNGVFTTGATRGDGEVGEDVTQNLKTIDAIPLRLERPIDCIVEGEVFMRKSIFDALNKERKRKDLPLLANPRNAASGAIRQLDPKIAAERQLSAFVYEFSWPKNAMPKTQKEELEFLVTLGFPVNTHWRNLKTIDEVIAFWKQWEAGRDSQDYWIDGIVVKVNNRSLQEHLGYTGKAPRFALAAKFSPEEKTTIIKKIIPSVGRTGKITPIALLTPVELKGTIVSRATLHNYDEVARLDVREGDTVIVRKAGDVIPQITAVVKELRPQHAKRVLMPQTCPVCDGSLSHMKEEVDLFCVNPGCASLRAKRLVHFASKAGLDIEGLGEKIILRLIDAGVIKDIFDMYDIRARDIEGLEGFGEKSAKNLARAIEKAKEVPLEKFFMALGIDYIGRQASLWLAEWMQKRFDRLSSPRDLLRIAQKIKPQDIETIAGMGPKASHSFIAFMRDSKTQRFLDELAKRGVHFSRPQKTSGRLEGKTFVFTGELDSMTRAQAQQRVEEEGGSVSDTVSGRIDYVVAGKGPGSKLDKAKKLGVRMLSEKEFSRLIQK